jgi:hypothetical protein
MHCSRVDAFRHRASRIVLDWTCCQVNDRTAFLPSYTLLLGAGAIDSTGA